MTTVVPDFDAFAPEHRADPYPRYALAREAAAFVPGEFGPEFVTRHAEGSTILTETRWSHSDEATIFHEPPPPGVVFPASFLWMDPPDHTRLRSLVSKAFTPKSVVDLTPRIEQLVSGLLDAARDAGEIEAVEAIAYPLPLIVICELLGVPAEDQHIVHHASPALARAFDPDKVTTQEERDDRDRATMKLVMMFRRLIAERMAEPRDDLMSGLGKVHDRGDTLTEMEMLTTCITLLVAGHETTVNMVANGLLAFARNPDQLGLLRDRPELGEPAVDEILRYDSTVHMTTRTARGELVVGDRTFSDGEDVCVLIGSANRDPRAFDRPDAFDVTRYAPGTSTPRHLGFALGIHYCMGAALARLEGAVLWRELARRFDRIEVSGELVYRPNLLLRGLRELPLRFVPAG